MHDSTSVSVSHNEGIQNIIVYIWTTLKGIYMIIIFRYFACLLTHYSNRLRLDTFRQPYGATDARWCAYCAELGKSGLVITSPYCVCECLQFSLYFHDAPFVV